MCVVVASSPPEAGAQTPSDEAKVSAWASGGTSTTTTPADKDGKPGAGVAPVGAIPFWQAPATPQAVVQGGAIPPGWQPQAVPYQGIGPDGRPMTMYIAPTYVFTYQSGPPVLAAPTVNRSQAYGAPQQPYPPGWNFATSGAQPVTPTLPPATVARYQPTPYQFPTDSRALTGTPVAPPAGVPAPPPQTWGTAPPAPQPPTQWGASDAAPAAAAPSSGDWVTVVPPAVAGAALAAGATAADTPSSEPQMAALPPPVTPVPAPSSIPAQPVSSSGMSSPPSASRAANSHLWRVVGVSDGDTVTCLDENNQQQKVRLAEIDAPEIGQDYGKNSREALAGMVFGKTVEVVDDGRDRYGRWIGHLSVDGMDVNRQMVATGNAWHYAAYSTDQNLAALQAQAQSQRIGLWSQPNPTSPWDYRASGK
ncbi:MAG: thermonuclease family protein [Planctomycetia bacterium]|nr:thermonuclease family protein [Planctomycetia bacterium]